MKAPNVKHKKEEKKIPNLRFHGFEEEWMEKRLGELCSTFKSGTGITSERISNKGRYPVFGGNGLRGYTNSFTHDGFYFLIGRQGALCGNINSVYGKSYISEHAIAADANETSDTEWLAQRLKFYNLNQLSESSAQPGLAVNKLVRLKLIVPSRSEQQKIASFLSAVDQKIQQLTRKKKLLEQYKKGVMQKIFSREIRFKPENGNDYPDWQEKRLGEVFEQRSEKGFEKSELLSVTINNGVMKRSAIEGKDNSSQDKSNYKRVLPSDLVYNSMRMWQGASGVSPYEGIVSPAYTVLKGNNKNLSEYFGYYFKMREVIFIFQRFSQGLTSDTWNLKYPQLAQIKFSIPSVNEQKRIASFLEIIDKKIEKMTNQLDQTQQFKKGLLQQMFV